MSSPPPSCILARRSPLIGSETRCPRCQANAVESRSHVNVLFLDKTGTLTTIMDSVLLIVFATPPVRLLAVGESAQRDWRPAVLAATILAALVLILRSASWRGFFELAVLGPDDYLWIVAGTAAWAAGLNAIWWTQAFERFLNLEDESPR